MSEHEGAVTVDSDGGSATILVKARVVPALQPTPEPAAAISVAAEAVRADAVPAEAVPAADSSARPGPRPDTVSGEAGPAPARERAAAEATPRPAPSARSDAATLLDAGFIVLAAALFIIGIDVLIPTISTAMWPWWVVVVACICGIAVALGAFRQYSVYASIITWELAWSLVWSISIIGSGTRRPQL